MFICESLINALEGVRHEALGIDGCSNANRLYETTTPAGIFAYAFMNPCIVSIAKVLVILGEKVSRGARDNTQD